MLWPVLPSGLQSLVCTGGFLPPFDNPEVHHLKRWALGCLWKGHLGSVAGIWRWTGSPPGLVSKPQEVMPPVLISAAVACSAWFG